MQSNDRTMAQAVGRRVLTAEARIRARDCPCWVCGGHSDTATGFTREFFGFTLSAQFHRSSTHVYHLGDEQRPLEAAVHRQQQQKQGQVTQDTASVGPISIILRRF